MIPEEELFAKGHRACAGCGSALAMRHALKAAGKNTIISHATGCMEVVSSPYPESAWRVPWIHAAFENAAAVGSGIDRALKKQGKRDNVNLLVIGGDGSTFDIGFQALSAAIERQQNFCYICYENNAYMNTGIQRSGATPKYASTTTSPAGKVVHGKMEWKKHMPLIVAAHNEGVYVATANIAFVQDYINKVKKGLSMKGPAYIQVYCPCPPGWKISPSQTVEVAKTAFKSKVTPLYEIENGVLKFTKEPSSFVGVKEYLKTQGRFKHMNEEEIDEVQKHLDKNYEKLKKLEETCVRL